MNQRRHIARLVLRNPTDPGVDGPRVDREVDELAPSQNIPESISPPSPLVDGPRVDLAFDGLLTKQDQS